MIEKNTEERKSIEAQIAELSSVLADEDLFEVNIENKNKLQRHHYHLKNMISERNPTNISKPSGFM